MDDSFSLVSKDGEFKLPFYKNASKETNLGNFLAVQWLGPCTFTAKGSGSVPRQGTKSPHGQKRKKKKRKKTNLHFFCSD